ncbi:MAG: YvcK family protein, partial [Cyanobacteria bacterium REEB65]|nr:YvcK family protein [Cyanobacteria bacterium REEB65]
MRNLLKWLTPGIGLKRWISLCVLGVLAQTLGAILLALVIHRVWRWHLPLNWNLVTGGVTLVVGGSACALLGGRNVVHAVVTVLTPSDGTPLVEAFYRNRTRRGARIVAIGGGTGLSAVLRGLKDHSDYITAIVAMADDGGSSGRLRAELGALPPGDVRNCLVALAGEEKLMAELFNYRFRQGGLEGHSFGNLFLTALADLTGDLQQAIRASSRVLAVRGQVLPATLAQVELVAALTDGSVIHGESRISRSLSPIARLWCEPADPPALPDALAAIREAEVLILGPGSLYTSIVTNLLVPDILAEIQRSAAPKIYVCNVMTQLGETDHFSVSDHVQALQAVGGPDLFDYVLVNQ